MKYWDTAWSLVEGCTPISPACDNCWLKTMNHRFETEIEVTGRGDVKLVDYLGNWSGDIIPMKSRLNLPRQIKKPTVFAVWSDLFHSSVPTDFIIDAFGRMEHCKQHTFLICTKRPNRMADFIEEWLTKKPVLNNCFLATTVENQEMADKRIPELLKCKPFNLFLSIEPMLDEIDLDKICLDNSCYESEGDIRPWGDINQIICGGETGRNARPCNPAWVRSLRDQCKVAGVPFFFKGWGKYIPNTNELSSEKYQSHGIFRRDIDGITHDDLAWRTKWITE